MTAVINKSLSIHMDMWVLFSDRLEKLFKQCHISFSAHSFFASSSAAKYTFRVKVLDLVFVEGVDQGAVDVVDDDT